MCGLRPRPRVPLPPQGPHAPSSASGAPGSQLLAAEEGLGLPAGGVHAERTAQGQLRGAALLGLEVCVDQVGQRLRDRREGQTVRSADPTAPHAAPAPRLPRGALGRGASLHLNY